MSAQPIQQDFEKLEVRIKQYSDMDADIVRQYQKQLIQDPLPAPSELFGSDNIHEAHMVYSSIARWIDNDLSRPFEERYILGLAIDERWQTYTDLTAPEADNY